MSGFYKVVAPLVLVRHDARDGQVKVSYAYQDAIVQLSDEQAEQFLAENLVAESDVEIEAEEPIDEPVDEKPGPGATKPELVDWIAANVAKDDGSDYTKTELRKLDADELRAIVDSVD